MFDPWFLLDIALDQVGYRRLERTLEGERAQTASRIRAAIADVRGQERKSFAAQEERLNQIIKYWQGRALVAEGMCHELGHTIVPPEIKFTDGNLTGVKRG